jgi:hypothetical protein
MDEAQNETYVILQDDERLGKQARHKNFNILGTITIIKRWSDGMETITIEHEHGAIGSNAENFEIL